jgi:hypothetical protein
LLDIGRDAIPPAVPIEAAADVEFERLVGGLADEAFVEVEPSLDRVAARGRARFLLVLLGARNAWAGRRAGDGFLGGIERGRRQPRKRRTREREPDGG